jgi:hypothetical protein
MTILMLILKTGSRRNILSIINGIVTYRNPDISIIGFKGFFSRRNISIVKRIKNINGAIIPAIKRFSKLRVTQIKTAAENIITGYFSKINPFFSNIEYNSHNARDETMTEKIKKYIPPEYETNNIKGIPIIPAITLFVKLLICNRR